MLSQSLRERPRTVQRKESQWTWQWEKTHDDVPWLFEDWIWPNTWETFKGRDVLDLGCGPGHHLALVARHCRHVTGVDLNAIASARRNVGHLANVTLLEGDIATLDLGRTFDVVYVIGVLHHTDDPAASFENALRHCRPGGRLIIWVYSREGNFLNRTFLEGAKKILVDHLPRRVVWELARVVTAVMYLPIYTLYLLPLPFLPFAEYFGNWRRLSFHRNLLNIFDKLNAPQTHFIDKSQLEQWFRPAMFTDVHTSAYKSVSWRASATRRTDVP